MRAHRWSRVVAFALLLSAVVGGAAGARERGKLGPFLRRLTQVQLRGGEYRARGMARRRGLRVSWGKRGRAGRRDTVVAVIVEPVAGAGAKSIDVARIERLGCEVDAASASRLRVMAPLRKLRRLSRLPDIGLVRAPYMTVAHGAAPVVSESSWLTGASELHHEGIFGMGVKVAVVDLGFIGLADTIAGGKLPWNTIVVDLPGTQDDDIETDTKHGVGVSEHVISMAPGVQLYCIKVSDSVDLENAVDYIRDNGIHVANHSVGWVNASYYDDTGVINGIINRSHDDDGVFWSISAGNDAKRHWRGDWSDPDTNHTHNFTSDDEGMTLACVPGSTAYIFLNWDQYDNPTTDLDLRVCYYDLPGGGSYEPVTTSTRRQGALVGPAEAVAFQMFAPGSNKTRYYVVFVERYSGSADGVNMTMFSFNHDFEHQVAASSLMDPANAHGAFSVAAIDFYNWDEAKPAPEEFSSQGPTNDGRDKPEIAAPDGTTSWTYGFEASFGTSFSSPTVAGAAALVLDKYPFLYPDETGQVLKALAVQVDPMNPGDEFIYGAGKLNLLGAVGNPVGALGADLSITKTVSPEALGAGGDLAYLITVTNRGGLHASGVTVTDVLPGDLTYVSADSSQGTVSETSGTVTAVLGDIAHGATATVTIVVQVGTTDPLSNAATVAGNEYDPDLANNTATAATRSVMLAETSYDPDDERWIDIAGNSYSTSFESNHDYSDATVVVHYDPSGTTFGGVIEATGLKPNFAYQIKLVGNRDYLTAFEAIGYLGRWWLSIGGTNFTDQDYEDNKDDSGVTIASYLFFDYFVTDRQGNAKKRFALGSTYHVIWSLQLNPSDAPDGDDSSIFEHTFAPDNASAYSPASSTETTEELWLEQEWVNTRPRISTVQLPAGDYVAYVQLTEECFHLEGYWPTVLSGDIAFTITDP